MPNLILDHDAMELAIQKLTGSPIYAGPDGTLLDPGIIDLVEGNADSIPWGPWDERTAHFLLGADTCKDILYHKDQLIAPASRSRAMVNLTVPLCKMMDVLAKLLPLFNDEESQANRKTWPENDQRSYLTVSRNLKQKRFRGPVRRVRNTFGAHPDTSAFGSPAYLLTMEDVLSAMGESILVLHLMLNHDWGCKWIREVGVTPEGLNVIDVFQQFPMTMRWVADAEGKVVDVFPPTFSADPRRILFKPITDATQAYNDIVLATGCKVPMLSVTETEYEDLFTEE